MAIIKIPRLEESPGSEEEFGIVDTYQPQAYTAGDWDGTDGLLVKFCSSTPEAKAIIDLSVCGDITVQYFDATDISFINGTVTGDETCIDGGNNDGIAGFLPPPPVVATVKKSILDFSSRFGF